MKKVMFLVISMLLLFSYRVEAKVIDKDYVDNSTYIIGSHMFTRNVEGDYKGQLTTQHIMLAAKTIIGEDIDDMVIYYKNARGKWVNALTTEEIVMEEQLNVEIVNLSEFLKKPTLNNPYANIEETTRDYVGIDKNRFMYDLAIDITSEIYDGWDIFEKTGEGTYSDKPIATGSMGGAGVVYVAPNTTTTLVAKIFILDNEGNKIYSEASNEFVINTTNNIETPVLSNPYKDNPDGYGIEFVGVENGKFVYDLATNITDEFYGGFGIFEKGSETPVAHGSIGGAGVVYVEPNTTKTYVAKLYIIDTDGNKFYGPASNELVIDTTNNIETPVLSNAYENKGYNNMGYLGVEKGKFIYDLNVNWVQGMPYDGWSLFEKGNDKELSNTTLGGANVAYVEANTSKTYVAKYFIKGNDGTKVYGPASNELVIDTTNNIEVPVLSNPYASSSDHPGGHLGVEKNKFIYDLAVSSNENTPYDGWSLFEKGNDKELSNTTLGGANVAYVEANTAKTYVAKFYVLLENGTKVYGPASNELVIDTSENIETPVFRNASVDGDGNPNWDGNLDEETGKYMFDVDVKNDNGLPYDGWSVFEKDSNEEVASGKMDHEHDFEEFPNGGIPPVLQVYLDANTTKTYYARFYYADADGNKVYGPASNELTFDITENNPF